MEMNLMDTDMGCVPIEPFDTLGNIDSSRIDLKTRNNLERVKPKTSQRNTNTDKVYMDFEQASFFEQIRQNVEDSKTSLPSLPRNMTLEILNFILLIAILKE